MKATPYAALQFSILLSLPSLPSFQPTKKSNLHASPLFTIEIMKTSYSISGRNIWHVQIEDFHDRQSIDWSE